MVVTNLRIPHDDWLRVKSTAASLGMSINEYIQVVVDEASKRDFFAYREPFPKTTKKTRLYESLWNIIEHPSVKKPMNASSEDEDIYTT